MKYKFIGCEIFYREACLLAARSEHVVDLEFLPRGLHDLETADMTAKVQQAVDATPADADYDAILLGYARCNDGLVGVQARDIPLVIPKAHDCITLFFGSREAFQRYFDANPGTYYETTGWIERNNAINGHIPKPAYGLDGIMTKLGLTESYDELIAKHGKENADYIVETLGGWERAYRKLCYIEMNTCDEASLVESSRQKAQQKGWEFEHRQGQWGLLNKLFAGPWDDDFIIVQPGEVIAARNDREIISTQPAEQP